MPTILVVEEDTMTRALTARALASVGGIAVLATSSVREARAVLSVSRPDAALIALELEDGLGLEVLEALDERGGVAMAMIPTSLADPPESPPGLARLQFLSRPIDYERLRQIAELWAVPGVLFNGPLAPIEYVQIALQGRHSVALHCTGPSGDALGNVVLHDGRVWSAVTPALVGEPALRELVERPDARVHVQALGADIGPANVDLDLRGADSVAPPRSPSRRAARS